MATATAHRAPGSRKALARPSTSRRSLGSEVLGLGSPPQPTPTAQAGRAGFYGSSSCARPAAGQAGRWAGSCARQRWTPATDGRHHTASRRNRHPPRLNQATRQAARQVANQPPNPIPSSRPRAHSAAQHSSGLLTRNASRLPRTPTDRQHAPPTRVPQSAESLAGVAGLAPRR